MTQKEVLESVLAEIRHVKTHMPNGELKQMANDFQKMKEDVSDLKKTLDINFTERKYLKLNSF